MGIIIPDKSWFDKSKFIRFHLSCKYTYMHAYIHTCIKTFSNPYPPYINPPNWEPINLNYLPGNFVFFFFPLFINRFRGIYFSRHPGLIRRGIVTRLTNWVYFVSLFAPKFFSWLGREYLNARRSPYSRVTQIRSITLLISRNVAG